MNPQLFFDAIADPTRRRILVLLRTQGELCVCELTVALEQGQPKISRHLATLKEAGLVMPRREGTWMHYRLESAVPDWVATILNALVESLVSELAADLDRLGRMQSRPERCAA